jgi:DNA-binding winged helix-turn-helix (wHTH) protein
MYVNHSFNPQVISYNPQVISYGKVMVDTDSYRVTYDGQVIPLLPKEYKLLLLFVKYPNHVLSYEVIVDRIWEIDKFPTPSSIRSHIRGLRKAFKKITNSEDVIETVHGLGYRLKPLKKEKSTNSIILPSLSVMQDFLKAKAVEYVVIDEKFIIKYISPGLPDYCDYPEALKVGRKAAEAFPEFVGYEEMFYKAINQECNNFEVKGIARYTNPNQPAYINFYLLSEAPKSFSKKEDKLLFVFFEDASEHMLYKQQVVQQEHDLCLLTV